VLKDEIKAGAPGGNKWAPLSVIGTYRGRKPKKTPYKRMAGMVRVVAIRKDTDRSQLGYPRMKTKHAFYKIAGQMEQQSRLIISEARRRKLMKRGREIARGRAVPREYASFFFLRKSTIGVNIPARPILDPFWNKHKRTARRNVRKNWERKARGEYI
jgi:hypothetical protein